MDNSVAAGQLRNLSGMENLEWQEYYASLRAYETISE